MIMFKIIIITILLIGMFLGLVIGLSIRIKQSELPGIEDVESGEK